MKAVTTLPNGIKMKEEMKMRNTVKAFLLAAGVLLSLTGCQKGSFGKVGQEVRFGAVTGKPETRTSYSNSNESETTGWERIDWKQGDIFRVYSSVAAKLNGNHYSDYYVNDGTPNGRISEASIENNEAGGLVWGEGTNDFYALYPYNAFEVTEETDAPGKVSAAKAAIPATQELTKAKDREYYPDMKYAYMLALAKGEAKSTVELNFYPYFTAFEFEVCADKNMKIKGFKMSSSDKGDDFAATPLSGEFTATPAETNWTVDDAPEISDENRSVTATFASPIELTLANGATKTDAAHFTVFAAPRDLTSLTLEFTVEVDGVEETRSLFVSYAKDGTTSEGTAYAKGDPVTFKALKKHNIKGIVLPASINHDIVLDFQVMPWEDRDGNMTYGPDAIANAVALEFASGAAVTSGSSRRQNNNFANATDPIHAYFSVFAPQDGTWKITATGATDKLLLATWSATAIGTPTTELTGNVGSRVDFLIVRKEGATVSATDQIQINFSVVTAGGQEININSEVTRASALTITGKIGQ